MTATGIWTNDWREQLDHMEGLTTVKEYITNLEIFLRDRQDRLRSGLISPSDEARPLHMVLMGNPGTGKTSVARLLGEMYRDLGFLKRGHVVEVTPKNLVEEHLGGTAKRTDEKINEALDGVLFIDEAYQLADQSHSSFGREAIGQLIARMENDRDRFAVVVAGYTKPMEEFLKLNEGLSSRFPEENRVQFPDYLPDELLNILRRFLKPKGLPESIPTSS
jgi:SpoVK/Ycf46/Vps4 family AAA+-type ATPase